MQLTNAIILAALATLGNAHSVNERSFEGPVLEARTDWTIGDCYSSFGSLTHSGTDIYQSQGACEGKAGSDVVIALTSGNDCYHGNELPPASDKVDSSKCSISCVGFPSDNCGGNGFYRIYTNGVVTASSGGSSSSSSSSSDSDSDSSSAAAPSSPPATTAAPSPSQVVITQSGAEKTVVVTQPNDASAAAATVSLSPSTSPAGANGGSSGSHSNTVAIAAGVVVGVLGAAAIAGAIFFWLRSRKHKEEAAELQRQNSVAGLRSEKPPSTYSMTDSRLEPAYMRRVSDASLADNTDYSRRILKIANPDDSGR